LIKKLEGSRLLIKNLKIFFTNLIKSDKKYVDPTDVAINIINDNG
jgi:hypothetical protein